MTLQIITKMSLLAVCTCALLFQVARAEEIEIQGWKDWSCQCSSDQLVKCCGAGIITPATSVGQVMAGGEHSGEKG
jgi:hypothetical protein